jgi:hypothetical protein
MFQMMVSRFMKSDDLQRPFDCGRACVPKWRGPISCPRTKQSEMQRNWGYIRDGANAYLRTPKIHDGCNHDWFADLAMFLMYFG